MLGRGSSVRRAARVHRAGWGAWQTGLLTCVSCKAGTVLCHLNGTLLCAYPPRASSLLTRRRGRCACHKSGCSRSLGIERALGSPKTPKLSHRSKSGRSTAGGPRQRERQSASEPPLRATRGWPNGRENGPGGSDVAKQRQGTRLRHRRDINARANKQTTCEVGQIHGAGLRLPAGQDETIQEPSAGAPAGGAPAA